MPRLGLLRISDLIDGIRAGLSRMEILALYPILALAAVWFGNWDLLLVTAFLLPTLLALQAFGRAEHRPKSPLLQQSVDGPTGFPRRPALTAMIDRAVTSAPGNATVAIAIGIDKSRPVAERWNRQLGDEILSCAATRLREALGKGGMIARIGETEFGIVLHPSHSAQVDRVLPLIHRLRNVLQKPISVGGSTVHVSASFGHCTLDMSPARTGDSVLSAAEIALGDARRHGASAIRGFCPELGQERKRQANLVDQVEAAVNNGEIKAWYQPQICTDTGLISGFEALARWHHPEDGVLAPGEFLGAVAEAGQMSRLGKVMLYNALSALKSWDRARLDIATVAVNFSTEELRDPLFADWIKWEVDRFDLRPNRLTVEILETVAAQSEDDIIIRNIELLSRHGVNLDLDDFGTGQASIANIRRFHVNRIKMDRSFVTKLDEDPTQYAMVSAILSLAEHLGLDTLAEGVETAGEHSTLAQLGCGYVQGFGIARPMPFEDTIAWVHAYNQKLGAPTCIRRQAG